MYVFCLQFPSCNQLFFYLPCKGAGSTGKQESKVRPTDTTYPYTSSVKSMKSWPARKGGK